MRVRLLRTFLLFATEGGSIRAVHLYDGSRKLHEVNGLLLTGEHRGAIDALNTFTLPAAHWVQSGIGLSFLFIADAGTGGPYGAGPAPRPSAAAAGAEYAVGFEVSSSRIVSSLTRP